MGRLKGILTKLDIKTETINRLDKYKVDTDYVIQNNTCVLRQSSRDT